MNENAEHNVSLGKIYIAMGCFLLFFSLVVLLSIFFTDTFIGKITNLGAGLILMIVSGFMAISGRRLKASGEGDSSKS